MGQTLREALSKAYDESVNDDAPTPVAADPVEFETPAVEPEPASKDVEPPPNETAEAKAERVRDEAGKFAKSPKVAKTAAAKPAPVAKTTAVSAVAPNTTKAPAVPGTETAAPAVPAFKPPQSWKPAAREQWAKLPADVQAEVARREKETSTALGEAAGARKFAEAFSQAVSPHAAFIQAQGGDPIRTVASLLQTAQALNGHPGQRAQAVAEIVKAFSVDIQALDQALAGQATGAKPAAQPEYRDPRVDKLFSTLEQNSAQRAQQTKAEAASEVESFAANAEFFEDVRQEMSMLMAVAAQQGRQMTMQQAYDKACLLSDSVSPILSQRQAAKAAETAKAATQRARAAGSSVKSSPSGGVGPGSDAKPSLRQTLEAAWDSSIK